MTRKELSQLYYLNKEIAELKRRLEELEALATSSACQINGMPRGSGISDMLARHTVEIADLRTLLELSLQKRTIEHQRLHRFIEDIADSQMRMIYTLRHMRRMSWKQIAENVGDGYTADSIRMAHDRYLAKN